MINDVFKSEMNRKYIDRKIIETQNGEYRFELYLPDNYLETFSETGLLNRMNELTSENKRLEQRINELEFVNDGLRYALSNIKKTDVEIDVDE